MLLWVAIVVAVLLIASLSIAGWRNRRVPFSTEAWKKGANLFTTDNPRLFMSDEVMEGINDHSLSVGNLLETLGPPDQGFEVDTPTGYIDGAVSYGGELIYVLGVKHTSALTTRSILVLTIEVPSPVVATNAWIRRVNYPKDGVIGKPTKLLSRHMGSFSIPATRVP